MSKPTITIDTEKEVNKTLEDFKKEYLRICKKLGVESITGRTYDHETEYLCRTVLVRELKKPFNEIVKAVGLIPRREYISPEMSKKLNEDILRLRLQEKSCTDIGLELSIDLTNNSILRRLRKVYETCNPETQAKLDAIKEKTIKGRYWKYQ